MFLLTNSTAFGCEGLRHLTVCRGVSYHSCFHTFKSIFLELAMIVALLNGKIHLLLPQKYCSFMFFAFTPRTGCLSLTDTGKKYRVCGSDNNNENKKKSSDNDLEKEGEKKN